MHEAHCLGLPTSATMMYGHVETPHQRVDHLLRIRDLQARCPEGKYGFIALPRGSSGRRTPNWNARG